MVIECKHVWDHISDYLDGTLAPEIREQVQKHLEHCEICSAILEIFDTLTFLDLYRFMSASSSFRSASVSAFMQGSRSKCAAFLLGLQTPRKNDWKNWHPSTELDEPWGCVIHSVATRTNVMIASTI